MKTTVSFQLVDSLEEETGMKVKNKPADTKNEEALEQDASSTEDPETAEVSGETLPVEQDSDPKVKEEEESEEEEENPDPRKTVDEALKCLFEDSENFTDELAELLNNELELVIESDTEISDLLDAKLSTKKRKSLAPSTFCGPKKSFPVPDCAHVVAARRLIGRYKGPGSKEEILSCVSTKAKALGCAGKKDCQEDSQEVVDQGVILSDLSDEELGSTILLVEKLMVERGLKAERKCDKCEDFETQVSDFEAEVPKLQDTITVLRSEWKVTSAEYTASEDAHSETLKEFNDSLKSMATTLLLLTDKDSSEEDLEARVKAMTLEDLKKIVSEVDISEVISLVRSGLSREPEGTVNPSEAEAEEVNADDSVLKLSESLMKLQKSHGTPYARDCMVSWRQAGKLPEDFTLDKAASLMAN
jgi:hypothetical protein